jgi:hypothetical protein
MARQKKSVILNPRKRRFLKGVLEGKSMRKSAIEAGYSQQMADTACRRIMPSVREQFQAELAKRIPLGKLTRRLAEGLDAHETKLFAHEGKVIEERTVIDFGQRRFYIELTSKLMGLLNASEEEKEPTAINISLALQDIRNFYGLGDGSNGHSVIQALPVPEEVDRRSEPPKDSDEST